MMEITVGVAPLLHAAMNQNLQLLLRQIRSANTHAVTRIWLRRRPHSDLEDGMICR